MREGGFYARAGHEGDGGVDGGADAVRAQEGEGALLQLGDGARRRGGGGGWEVVGVGGGGAVQQGGGRVGH